MPYHARISVGGESIHIKEAITMDMHRTYYCIDPKCSCAVSVRAVNSNKRPAHFGKIPSSSHRTGCMATLLDKELHRNPHGPIILEGSSPEDLLKLVSAKPYSLREGRIVKKKKKSSTEADETVSPIRINSLKNLYLACKELSLNTPFGSKKLGDVYVGIENSYIFTRYISGLKLIECKFENINSQNGHRFINLTFPFSGDIQFRVLVIVDDKDEFNYLSKINVNNAYPVLVYTGSWHTTDAGLVVGHINSRNQIVFLKKKRKVN